MGKSKAKRTKTSRLPWRVQSDDDGGFDEIVVGRGDTLMLHAEMMSDRSMFVDVAGLKIWVGIGKDGKAYIADREEPQR